MGLLKLSGTLDVAQFWNTGQSDADTAKVIVSAEGDSFQFSTNGATDFKTTRRTTGSSKTAGRSRRSTSR